MDSMLLVYWLALTTVLAPMLAAGYIGGPLVLGRTLSERAVMRVVSPCLSLAVLSSLALAGCFAWYDLGPTEVALGSWFSSSHYAFEASLLLDRLSLSMVMLVAVVCGVIGRFSATYLVGEPGQARFYLLLSVFASGMFLLVMAGSVDLLIVGWELVGISSMLLIAFFHERTFPVRNGLRAFVIYRVCDVGLLSAAVLLHHWAHSSKFLELFGTGPWPHGASGLEAPFATIIALCLLWAAMGKSALFPVGSWLPRAMEGPTPSSAIFYGALSVHAGAYLLLRISPLLEQAPAARAAIVTVGVLSAVHGTLVTRVQTDVKSQLAYATSTQVSVIFIEIGLGFPRLALLHLLGHACLRTLQMLRAPNVIADMSRLRAAARLASDDAPGEAQAPSRGMLWAYQVSLERFYLDVLWERCIARPCLALGAIIERCERGITRWAARAPKPHVGVTASMDREGSEVP